MFNVNANLNLDVNIVLAIQGQKRPFQVLDGWEDKLQRKNITDHLWHCFLVEHGMKKTKDKKLH